MRADGHGDTGGGNNGSGTGDTPIYPGLKSDDNRAFDPGLSVDDKFERTAPARAGRPRQLVRHRARLHRSRHSQPFNIS
jgi:hypothetical protein